MDLTCPPPVLFHEMSPLAPTLPPYGQSASVHACVFVCMDARVCCMSRVVLTSHIYKEWRDDEQNSFHGNCWHRVMKKKGGGGGERELKKDKIDSQGDFCCLFVWLFVFPTPLQHIHVCSLVQKQQQWTCIQGIMRKMMTTQLRTYWVRGKRTHITHNTCSVQPFGV